MGYRSNVAVAIKANIEIPKEIKEILASIFGRAATNDEGQLFYTERISWHDFEEGSNCHTLMKFLKDLEGYDDFYFARVGEDTGDFEELGGWHEGFDIYVDTIIKFDAAVTLRGDIYFLSQPAQKSLNPAASHLNEILSHCATTVRLSKSKKSPDLKMVEAIRAAAEELTTIADKLSEVMQ